MSYDIYIINKDGDTLTFKDKQDIKGAIYQVGGTKEAYFNITYNYSNVFEKVLGERGIYTLDAKKTADTLDILQKAADSLNDDISDDYWRATQGNVKKAILNLIKMAKLLPNGYWKIL